MSKRKKEPAPKPVKPAHTGVVFGVYDADCECWLYYDNLDAIGTEHANDDVWVFTLDGIKTLRVGRHLEE